MNTIYTLRVQAGGSEPEVQGLPFVSDHAAIWYALPLARGKLVEVWRGERLIATVDERPEVLRGARGSGCAQICHG